LPIISRIKNRRLENKRKQKLKEIAEFKDFSNGLSNFAEMAIIVAKSLQTVSAGICEAMDKQTAVFNNMKHDKNNPISNSSEPTKSGKSTD